MNWKYINNNFTINDESLLISEFKELFDLGEIGLQHLKFVYLVCDISEDNPFRNMDYKEKEEKAEAICYSKDKTSIFYIGLAQSEEIINLITRAYHKYNELTETSPKRLIVDIDNKIDEIRRLVKTTEPKIHENINVKTGAITFATNLKIITDVLQEIDSLMATRESIDKRINKEATKVKAKGNKERSPIQEGMLKKVQL